MLDQRRQYTGYLTKFAGYVNWMPTNWLKSPNSICGEGCLSCLYRDAGEVARLRWGKVAHYEMLFAY